MRNINIIAFLICLLLTILTLATNVAFQYYWLAHIIYCLTILLSFIVAGYIKNKDGKAGLKFLSLLFLFFIISQSFIFPGLLNIGDWRTVSVSHRQVNHPGIYIGQQMLDVGARGYKRRMVQVTPVIPLLNWITPADTTRLSNKWMRVRESYNPFNWKY
jgi:energy-coupling factor transporter transmembrane protein EcfT